MGIIKVSYRICNPSKPEHCIEVQNAVVDTGSTFTWAPKEILDKLDIKPIRTGLFKTIEGKEVRRSVGVAVCEVAGRKGGCDVVFGEDNDASVLGATAMESIGIEIDPMAGKISFKDSFLAL